MELSLSQRFEQQAQRTPDAPAVIFGEQSLSYAALNARANQLAHALQSRALPPETAIGICMHRSFEMAVAVLGILKAGAAYVPLDPAMPVERRDYMIADARLALILTQPHLVETLAGAELLVLDDDLLAAQPAENLAPQIAADSAVYVTYTSGSTGRPKGIQMTQRPLQNLIDWMIRTTSLPPGARTLQFASLSFDVSFQDLFSTWLSGDTLVLITEAQRLDISGLAALLDRYEIARIFLPAVALQQLALGFNAGQYPCRALRKIISGSEQLMITPTLRAMFERLPDCRLHNEYGPSETHVVTELAMPAELADWVKRPAIGKPIDHTQIHILAPDGRPVPEGELGELHIGGISLARGYLGRPELTAEKFILNPFSPDPGARMYRTGDQARRLPNGDYEFLGRLDQQIKIRGYRIEPGDIESALEKHPQVQTACVLGREMPTGEKRLVAYLGTGFDAAPTVSDLHAFLAAKLPDYMIPSSWMFLARLPLNANGKVDRKALPEPDDVRPELAAAYVEPQSALEQFLATLWGELLGLRHVGTHDNFFELGGNSLLLVSAHEQLQKHLGRPVPVTDLFEHVTITELVQHLTSTRPAANEAAERAAKQRAALARRPLARQS